jgi:hypothetical protein
LRQKRKGELTKSGRNERGINIKEINRKERGIKKSGIIWVFSRKGAGRTLPKSVLPKSGFAGISPDLLKGFLPTSVLLKSGFTKVLFASK